MSETETNTAVATIDSDREPDVMQVGETRHCPPDLLAAIKRLVHFVPNPIVNRGENAVIAFWEYNDGDAAAQWEIDLHTGEITRQEP